MKREQLCNIAVALGLLVMLVMAALPLLNVAPTTATRVTYAAGAAIVPVARLLQPAPPAGASLRERRLHRLLMVSALLFAVSAALLFLPQYVTGRDSIAFLMAGAALQAYAGTMLDRINAKR